MKIRENSRLYGLFLGVYFICCGGLCLAANNSPFNDDDWNTMTLETYYPSPYGEYEELRTYYFTVGSGYASEKPGDGNMIVSGTVGIGTKSPDTSNYKLDIEGNANVKGNANVSADLIAGRICLSGTCRDSFSSGSGTQNKVAKWTSGSDLGDSSIQDDGAKVAIWGKPVVIDSSNRNPVSGYSLSVDNLYLMGGLNTASISGSVYGYTSFNDSVGIKKVPSATLDVGGAIKSSSTINAEGDIISASIVKSPKFCIGGSCITSWPAGSTGGAGESAIFGTGSAESLAKWLDGDSIMPSIMREDSAGRVGMGCLPYSSYRLTVCNDSSRGVTYGSYFLGDVTVDSSYALNASKICLSGTCQTSWSGGGSGSSNQWQTSGSDIYYNAGKVGIGTIGSPSKKLEVSGGNALFNGMVGIGASASVPGDFPGVYLDVAGASAGNTIARFRGGRVAVGRETADTVLDVNGVITNRGAGTTGGIYFNGHSSHIYEGSAGHLYFRKGSGSDTRFYFEKNNGDNIARIDNNGNLYIAGSLTQNYNFSDIRVKKDISDITDALSVINKLHPVRYRFVDKFLKEHESFKDVYYYNFIAQEFEKVFPDSVTKGDDGYLRIDIHNVSIYLTAAVQELSRKIEILEAENNSLKQANAGLEPRISALEQEWENKKSLTK